MKDAWLHVKSILLLVFVVGVILAVITGAVIIVPIILIVGALSVLFIACKTYVNED